jgi:hypothetical protein
MGTAARANQTKYYPAPQPNTHTSKAGQFPPHERAQTYPLDSTDLMISSPVLTHHQLNPLPSSCRTNLLYRRSASMQLLCMPYNSSSFAPFYLYLLLLHNYIIILFTYLFITYLKTVIKSL